MTDLNLADIQGNILRGYNMPLVLHLVLRVTDPGNCRRLLGKLVSGTESDNPQITSAAVWSAKPRYTMNLGVTASGLAALGLSNDDILSFPEEFRQGSAERAAAIGDVGESAPENWIEGLASSLGKPPEAHLLLSIHALNPEALVETLERLMLIAEAKSAIQVLSYQEGQDLPDSRVHFGYKDGLSQPTVSGGPNLKHSKKADVVPTGEFLLGYPSQFPGFQYPVPTPPTLGFNGTFFAYRVFKQDVVGFENYLQSKAVEVNKDKEWIAAKLCGRWRNGVPLALSPDTDSPVPPILPSQLNDFDYVQTPASLDAPDDTRGYRCPISSHIRRSFPRNEQVAGGGGARHRIIRRALPYGPVYYPQLPSDDKERGLLMQIICVSLLEQFEFLMTEWINGESFAAGVSCKDPFLGSNDLGDGTLKVPQANSPPVMLDGLARFIVTRGSLYCFMPSMSGLRFLANL